MELYEHRSEPLISWRAFGVRFARHLGFALVILGGSLVIGVVGYATLGHLSLVDAFLNASMILGGMGPVDVLQDNAAKVFAGIYALYSGVVFLVVAGILFAPLVHRILHRISLDPADDDAQDGK